MSPEITQLAALLMTATVLGLIAWRWRQPMIVAYVLTGIIASLGGWLSASVQPWWQIFSNVGIALLLFLVGLEINYSALRRVGSAALVIGLGQVIFTFTAGFMLISLFGFAPLIAGYIAIALTFSSTVMVVKILSEKNEMSSLHGKMALGILLVQDLVAILLLVILGAVSHHGPIVLDVAAAVMKAGILCATVFWFGRRVMPRLFDFFAHSRELLFLASLAWMFFMATLAEHLGFSLAVGGFLGGLALANSSEHWQIASRIRPLRDFFIAIFFIFLGAGLSLGNIIGQWWPIAILSVFVLVANPLIVVLVMRGMGYHHRTSFLTGLSMTQVSEFSFVLAALGAQLGHLPAAVVTIITTVGIITILISSSLILHGAAVYRRFQPFLIRWLGPSPAASQVKEKSVGRPIVLIGAHRTGRSILQHLRTADVVVIDFDPDVTAALRQQKKTVLFGDAGDTDMLEAIDWSAVQVVISTSPNLEDHRLLLEYLRQRRRLSKIKVVLRADTADEARTLYQQGAAYVLFPSMTAGQYLGQAMSRDPSLLHVAKLRQHDLTLLNHSVPD